jgi:hypothetical protein
MKNLREAGAALRRRDRRQYTLLVSCIFISVLLITAYVCMMRSPTILAILPQGGDSRKQVMMIFALAVVGCAVFTTYAASLFFRYKSREAGIFMALGASRRQVRGQLFRELAAVSVGSCAAGAVLGAPLAWCVWQFFRLFLVDTKEMSLSFDPKAYLFTAVFALYTILALFLMGAKLVRRTDIMDVVNEQRKSEPIHDVKPWCGPLGIVLIFAGGLGGRIIPNLYEALFSAYPPAWLNIFYLPLMIGLYMVLLHTVIRGWRRGKSRYRHMISRSIMKFQGRQTVNSMLVLTVLIAGAYFAAFYTPTMSAGSTFRVDRRPVDYAFRYREDQDMLTKDEIEAMASKDGVTTADWKEAETAVLGRDGNQQITDKSGKYHYEYKELLGEGNFISESSFNKMSGQNVDIRTGKVAVILAREANEGSAEPSDALLLTNMTTRKTLSVSFQEYLHDDMLAFSNFITYYVLDDTDYTAVTEGLADSWRETIVFFNVKDVMQTYDFAKELYNSIVDHSSSQQERADAYDRVGKIAAEEAGESYWGDESRMTKLSYHDRDSAQFKMHWKYAPQFRVLDRNDLIATYAVFLMLFIFIAIVCFAAVLVISYTRSLTIALNNRQIYDDLRHLGAAPNYLYRSVREQISKVFGMPSLIGTLLICAFYVMILFANDNQITPSEISSMMSCLVVVLGISAGIWAFYRFTLHKVCVILGIKAFKKQTA